METNKKIPQVGALERLAQKLNEKIPTNVSELANDAGYQTAEQVAAAVAAADHLTRVIVTGVDAIDPAAAGADKHIYMVPKTDGEEGDLYDEYMVLDGELEYVGDTAVNLEGYVQKEEGKNLSSNDYTDEEKAKLADIEVASDTEIDAMLAEVFGS